MKAAVIWGLSNFGGTGGSSKDIGARGVGEGLAAVERGEQRERERERYWRRQRCGRSSSRKVGVGKADEAEWSDCACLPSSRFSIPNTRAWFPELPRQLSWLGQILYVVRSCGTCKVMQYLQQVS